MKKIAIATPAGQVGSQVVKTLLDSNAQLVLLGLSSHREKLQWAINRGAEFREASMDDSKALALALEGCERLFWLTPPQVASEMRQWYEKTSQAAATAIRQSGVKYVVNISGIGAGAREGLGTITYTGDVEQTLNAAAPNVVHLRPGYFMENLLLQKELIKGGSLSFPFSPGHDIPWITAQDIGQIAAEYLSNQNWAGHWIRHLMGPENLTGPQVADLLSKALKKKVVYQQSSYDDTAKGLLAAGVSPEVAKELIQIFQALGDEDGVYAIPRTYDAYTPTRMEDFIERVLLK